MSRVRGRGACLLAILSAIAAFGAACRADKTPEVSVELEKLAAARPPAHISSVVWTDVRKFYATRKWSPAWVDGARVSRRATAALDALRLADRHGLSIDRYQESAIRGEAAALEKVERDAPGLIQRLARIELQLTSAWLTLGRDIAVGRGRPESIDARWKRNRRLPDLTATLHSALDGDLSRWLEGLQPAHPEYAALQNALVSLRARQDAGGWPAVPNVAVKAGRRHAAVVTLRERLRASGDLTTDRAVDLHLFDRDVARAVKSFQTHHGLVATGALDSPTLAAMNVPLDTRLAQIAINLERWRWIADDLGGNHLLVNIPAYHLIAREHGVAVRDIRVVVGKIGDETPIFSDEITTVVFSPYWNIPETIAFDETVPALENDSDYLTSNNIEIIRTGSTNEVVDPSTIDWDNPEELGELSFRQRPGPGNALGHVKFLFPNPYNVYLHDTPADSYFSRRSRALSHGCVRVEEPEVLASYMLRQRPEWTDTAIAQAMHAGQERQVALPHAVPIHLVYFTSWVDHNGGLHFRDDVYGYDEKQLRGWTGYGRAR